MLMLTRMRCFSVGLLVLLSACAAVEKSGEPVAVADLNYTLKDMNNQDVRLQDFKGRPLLINFWATWCAPCKHEIPILVELAEKYKEQGFTVLGITTDDRPDDALRRFAAEFKMNYPILIGLGQDKLLATYDAEITIPISWFVRPDGTVLRKHQGSQSKEWFEAQVKQLLATPSTASAGVRNE